MVAGNGEECGRFTSITENVNRRLPSQVTNGDHTKVICNLCRVCENFDIRRFILGAPLSFRPPIDQVTFDVIPLDNTQPPITVQILKKLDEIFNVVKESNELLKKLAISTPQ